MLESLLRELGIDALAHSRHEKRSDGDRELVSRNPATGETIGHFSWATIGDLDREIDRAERAFLRWRMAPAPQRGECVRQLGQALRIKKPLLARLVTLECGKPIAESAGEVQEMIDICDFAVGLSRQLNGWTMPSERSGHRLQEQWHPLGPVGVITAFNFPVAVWAWNAAIAAVCGDTIVWKPSLATPLISLAVQKIAEDVTRGTEAEGVFRLCLGDGPDVGLAMADDRRLPLISATGSCAMGAIVGPRVAARFGRSILELGGNNAAIVAPSADLDLALRAVLFGAVGTSGQRCTSLRRLFLHESLVDSFVPRLVRAYGSVRIGDGIDPATLMGPLISERAIESMMSAIDLARSQGGEILYGGRRLDRPGYFVEPTLIRAAPDMPIVAQETFAPILYVMSYKDLDEAIARQNSVRQGLSSAIFTDSLREAERFLSSCGSDCGLANVNTGTSGAEIGGAFGGEKETGGGREAGSDAWKSYMRRQTSAINFSHELPLAQGVIFQVDE